MRNYRRISRSTFGNTQITRTRKGSKQPFAKRILAGHMPKNLRQAANTLRGQLSSCPEGSEAYKTIEKAINKIYVPSSFFTSETGFMGSLGYGDYNLESPPNRNRRKYIF